MRFVGTKWGRPIKANVVVLSSSSLSTHKKCVNIYWIPWGWFGLALVISPVIALKAPLLKKRSECILMNVKFRFKRKFAGSGFVKWLYFPWFSSSIEEMILVCCSNKENQTKHSKGCSILLLALVDTKHPLKLMPHEHFGSFKSHTS